MSRSTCQVCELPLADEVDQLTGFCLLHRLAAASGIIVRFPRAPGTRERSCDECGQVFEQVRAGRPAMYCSHACWKAVRRRRWRENRAGVS